MNDNRAEISFSGMLIGCTEPHVSLRDCDSGQKGPMFAGIDKLQLPDSPWEFMQGISAMQATATSGQQPAERRIGSLQKFLNPLALPFQPAERVTISSSVSSRDPSPQLQEAVHHFAQGAALWGYPGLESSHPEDPLAFLALEEYRSATYGKLMAEANAYRCGWRSRINGRQSVDLSEDRKNFFADETCVICMEQKPDVGYLPCRHLVACVTCEKKIPRPGSIGCPSCPVCRHPVEGYCFLPAYPMGSA